MKESMNVLCHYLSQAYYLTSYFLDGTRLNDDDDLASKLGSSLIQWDLVELELSNIM